MAINIKLPDIGEYQVEVTKVLVSVGDKITEEQSIIIVKGILPSIEIHSPHSGLVKDIKVAVGDKITTGNLIMIVDENDIHTAAQLKEVKVPDIGIDEVEVTDVLVTVGDKITKEQSILTVEGDKVSMEVPAPFDGTVKDIKVNVGNKVKTGSIIMMFEVKECSDNAVSTNIMKDLKINNNVHMPDIGNDELEVTEVMVKVGDKITKEQSILTVEGDKVSIEVPAPFDGTVKEIKVNVGNKVKTGSIIMVFDIESTAPTDKKFSTEVVLDKKNKVTKKNLDISEISRYERKNELINKKDYVHATPVIRRIAREFDINLAHVKGTGHKGRILREDIKEYIKNTVNKAETTHVISNCHSLPELLPWPKLDFSKFGETIEVELTRIQKISSANLHRNWMIIPHVTQFDEADITEIEEFRKNHNAEAEKKKLEIKITLLGFIIKAVSKALETFPRFNSSLSDKNNKLILKKYINIGVAVDTPNGLVVPVFRNVNKKGILEISRELAEISKKSRSGKLISSDIQGGSFTISSLGNIGGTAFTPIVNAPEVAILGVSKSTMKPVWNGKKFTPRLKLPLSLSYDHRVIDGADGARFISFINNIISDIRYLLM
ncbi:Dihydrolipoyllysine-residue acetyltransferase component of pyruvate dehydrogenase complex [Candidatus Mikella endobia]|uniref:Acetyltransferase component of pyruvate dehydrogenase complex n=1 Tax=Candidatus Mikella endobia TaxID=1778264 RepID=A0A143WR64_9ENTR|nr:pyruvate dehydrogenase complex dihydrolipoyllysine-residue acetyltransferase [Candidatus Mikella endobia]CUX96101.1 Dihydrolipoyllysine-residue acetyltransferase component of pyruvate dehydrogenase complex [Candidatus Mikella endobia]